MEEFYYIALRKHSVWDKNDQFLIQCKDWKEAVRTSKAISLTHNGIEVRLSETPGFNNQGHYFFNEPIN